MSYATTNPPRLWVNSVGGGPQMWAYTSADDDATVNGADYISNASDLGMRAGDAVFVWDTATPKGSYHYVSAISAAGAATLAFGATA